MTSTMANKTLDPPQVCVPLDQSLKYQGIFSSGTNFFDYIISFNTLHIIFFVFISRAIHVILKPLNQPKIVCNILAGIILGPSVLGQSKSYREKMFAPKEMTVLATMSNMAAFFIIFIICIKIKPNMVSKVANKTWKIGLASIGIPFLITLILTEGLRNFLPGIHVKQAFTFEFSLASSLSYYIVIAHSLDELNLLSSELGQLSTSIAMLNEIVSFFVVVIGVTSGQKDLLHSIYVIFSIVGLLLSAIFIIRPVLQWIINRTPEGKPVEEGYVIAIILWTLLLSVFTDAIGISFTFAAMIMGYIIPDGPPLGATIIKKSELLISEVFLPCFFLRIGYFTDLSKMQNLYEFASFGVISLVPSTGRLVGCYMFGSTVDLSNKMAILLGLSLSSQGMVELLQGIQWKHRKVFSDQDFATWVLSIVVLNAIITPIIKIFYKPTIESDDKMLESFRYHTRSLGMTSIHGELRIISCVQDEDNVPTMVSLLKALYPNEGSQICAYVIHLVPLATQTVPILLPYKNRKRRFNKPNGSDKIMRAFLNYSRDSRGALDIQPFRMVAPLKYMHEPICRLAESTRTPLIIVPFFKRQELQSTDGSLRIFSTNIQALAKCTAGILVDRGFHNRLNLASFSYNVAVVFLGGVDDREALVFAARMSSHPNVSVTVLRIRLIRDAAKGFEQGREQDEFLFRDFKSMNNGNAGVVCHELEADNSEDVMSALRALVTANSYNLVIVGKRQGYNSQFEESLIEWTEYRELGVIGDAIAQPDFGGRMMSVLVLQHFAKREELGSSRSTCFLQC